MENPQYLCGMSEQFSHASVYKVRIPVNGLVINGLRHVPIFLEGPVGVQMYFVGCEHGFTPSIAELSNGEERIGEVGEDMAGTNTGGER